MRRWHHQKFQGSKRPKAENTQSDVLKESSSRVWGVVTVSESTADRKCSCWHHIYTPDHCADYRIINAATDLWIIQGSIYIFYHTSDTRELQVIRLDLSVKPQVHFDTHTHSYHTNITALHSLVNLAIDFFSNRRSDYRRHHAALVDGHGGNLHPLQHTHTHTYRQRKQDGKILATVSRSNRVECVITVCVFAAAVAFSVFGCFPDHMWTSRHAHKHTHIVGYYYTNETDPHFTHNNWTGLIVTVSKGLQALI